MTGPTGPTGPTGSVGPAGSGPTGPLKGGGDLTGPGFLAVFPGAARARDFAQSPERILPWRIRMLKRAGCAI